MVRVQRRPSYYQVAAQAVSFSVRCRQQAFGPTRFVRWDGGSGDCDLEALRREMRRAVYPVLELRASVK